MTPCLPPTALFSLRTAIRRAKRHLDDAPTAQQRARAGRDLAALRLTVHELAMPVRAEVAA